MKSGDEPIELSAAEEQWLREVARIQSLGFSGMLSGRTYRREVGERLSERGLLARIMLQPADGDGWLLEGHSQRQGYALTPKGAQALEPKGNRKSCNRHVDCEAADERARQRGRSQAEHCRDETCEDCFGT
jgi:hypothetical protein